MECLELTEYIGLLIQLMGVITGGMIGFLSAVFVDYFRHKREEKKAIDIEIKKTFLDECIVSVRTELSFYGNITMKTINKVRRDFHFLTDVNELKEYLKEIKSRSEVQTVISYEFVKAHGSSSYLYKFGEKVPASVQYVFWWYSGFLDDVLNERRMREFIGDPIRNKEIQVSLTHVIQIVQELRIWLEKKLLALEQLFRKETYESYSDFEKKIRTKEVIESINQISGIREVFVEEEKKRDRGEQWGQGIIDYIKANP